MTTTSSNAPAPSPLAEAEARPSLFDRTLARLRGMASSARPSFMGGDDPDLPDDEAGKLEAQMRACLEAPGGEVLARAQAATIAHIYLTLSPAGRVRFLRTLARAFAPDPAAVDAAIDAYRAAADEAARTGAEARLRRALTAPWLQLLTQFNALPEGIKFLVDMRAELLPLVNDGPRLRALDDDFRELLASWFDVGFLRLERITWASPAALLEKLIAYEAVHEITSWHDLRHRLHGNRRCYAFFHPAMPGEPLIFVQVALVEGIAGSVQRLLDPAAPNPASDAADTAIFYSISNAQAGLRGISFGNFLIKRVVDELARDLPNLRSFATLSPLPGFRAWLKARLDAGGDGLVTEDEAEAIVAALAEHGREAEGAGLKTALALPGWQTRAEIARALEAPLSRAAARYLAARRPDGRPLDPVARFHLGNGARVERVNHLADTSRAGLAKAAGVMVNYLYDRDEIERNHEAYARERVLTVAPEIADLFRGTGLLKDKDAPVRVSRGRSTLGRMIRRG